MHGLALVGVGEFIADQHAILVMFIGRHDMRVSRRPRQRPRRDAAIGKLVTVIAAVDRRDTAVEADHFTSVDWDIEIQLRRIHAGAAFGKQ